MNSVETNTKTPAQNFKFARVAIMGRPNAGKSTLLNSLLEVSLSATSKRPQTTRTNIRGIIQLYGPIKEWNGQLVLVDTPGVNFKKGLLDRSMYMAIEGALGNVDLVIWVADARSFEKDLRDLEMGRPGSDRLAAWLKDRLQSRGNTRWILALSKTDTCRKPELLPVIQKAALVCPEFTDIVPIAAGLGIQSKDSNLQILLSIMKECAPIAKPEYDEHAYTDLNEKQLIQNLVREAIFRQGREEVPYQCDCTIVRFQEPNREEGRKLSEVNATIWVSKNSLKPILVGKSGSRIKEIGTFVRARYTEITGQDLVLKLMVKVVEKWETRANSLQELGYVL